MKRLEEKAERDSPTCLVWFMADYGGLLPRSEFVGVRPSASEGPLRQHHAPSGTRFCRTLTLFPGATAGSSRPYRRQPTASSHVRAFGTGRRNAGPVTSVRQPSNTAAEL